MNNLKSIESKVITQKLKPYMNLEDLPEDLHISTVTLTCCLNTEFYLDNISKYVDLSDNGILRIRYGEEEDATTNRSIIPEKKNNKRNKKSKKAFYNQATVIIKSKTYNNTPNVKLFKNGTIQMTGIKSLKNFVEVIEVLCTELKKVKAIVNKKTMKDLTIKKFVSKPEVVDPENISKLSIRMINSNFNIGFKINREKFYNLLLSQNVNCTFESCAHAGVNIKHAYKEGEQISIFVFESGAIIITGAKNREHIMSAYNFIVEKIHKNYYDIVQNKITIDNILKRKEFKKINKEMKVNKILENPISI